MTEGLVLPGWFCGHCNVFNGSAKEELSHCRCCGHAREPQCLVCNDGKALDPYDYPACGSCSRTADTKTWSAK